MNFAVSSYDHFQKWSLPLALPWSSCDYSCTLLAVTEYDRQLRFIGWSKLCHDEILTYVSQKNTFKLIHLQCHVNIILLLK